jgi:hypothetical protein
MTEVPELHAKLCSDPILRRTMDPYIESPQLTFVPGSSLRAYSPFSLSRLALPALCVAIAASVGTATGITLAMDNAPNGVVEASSSSAQASSTRVKAGANLALSANAASTVKTTVTAPPATSPSKPVADAGHSAPKAADLHHSTASRAVETQSSTAAQAAFSNPPDAIRPATFTLDGKEWPVAQLISMPVAEPVRQQGPSAPLTASTALDPVPSSLDKGAKPAIRYTEGVLTVAAYDAITGTIQASDGKTFVLGTTVAAGNATSWDEYRSGVRYRCDQSGSCTLMRAGAVAPNARLI